jgi:hypothetical protein
VVVAVVDHDVLGGGNGRKRQSPHLHIAVNQPSDGILIAGVKMHVGNGSFLFD